VPSGIDRGVPEAGTVAAGGDTAPQDRAYGR